MPRWWRECGLSLIYNSIGSLYWQSYSLPLYILCMSDLLVVSPHSFSSMSSMCYMVFDHASIYDSL